MKLASRLATLAALVVTTFASPASALELTGRRLEVSGGLDTKTAMKLASDLMKLDEAGGEPIYLLITGSGGSAQGIMLLADAIRSLEAPVVGVVMAPVHGATATLPVFTDRVVMLPSAQLVLTEVEYEGVPRPPEAKADDKADPKADKKEPTKSEAFLQKVRKDYLDRFWGAVGKRMGDKGNGLQAEIEGQGGKVVTAQEALSKKIAFEVVSSLSTSRAPAEKTELKVTTTRNATKIVPKKVLSN